jgi:hypothetical protein
MAIKLYIDDVRQPPDSTWVVARNGKEALEIIDSGVVITEISFDHDLGDSDSISGYDVACHVENLVCEGVMHMPIWHVHSANPPGRMRIAQAMQFAEQYIARKQRNDDDH